MSKQFLIVLAAIVIILGGIVFVTNHNKQGGPAGSSNTPPTSHTEGKGSTGVTLIEYGDYQCPACGDFEPTVEQVRAKYADKITFQFRNLPLTSLHPNAFSAARAAEAADLQGKFWQMHDLLYANQSVWSSVTNPLSTFDGYARQLSLNVTKFDQDYASEQVNQRINADMSAFAKLGYEQSTPTFILDGTRIDNSKLVGSNGQPSLDAFSKLIDTEIAKKAPKQ